MGAVTSRAILFGGGGLGKQFFQKQQKSVMISAPQAVALDALTLAALPPTRRIYVDLSSTCQVEKNDCFCWCVDIARIVVCTCHSASRAAMMRECMLRMRRYSLNSAHIERFLKLPARAILGNGSPPPLTVVSGGCS